MKCNGSVVVKSALAIPGVEDFKDVLLATLNDSEPCDLIFANVGLHVVHHAAIKCGGNPLFIRVEVDSAIAQYYFSSYYSVACAATLLSQIARRICQLDGKKQCPSCLGFDAFCFFPQRNQESQAVLFQ